MMQPRSALVTGGNGFIGRRLVRRLLAEGCTVALLQRSSDPVDARTELLQVPSLSVLEVARALAGRSFDWVFHLSGYGVRPGDRDVETMFRINVDVTRELVNAASRWSPRAVVITGSGSEYQLDSAEGPVAEDHPLEARKLYGASKAAGTLCSTALASVRGTPFAACRLFGVYGPGEAPHRLLPSLIEGLRSGRRIALSSGLQKRDFLFVDDAVEALVRVAVALEANPGQLILNVGTGRPISVQQFVQTAAALLDIPATRLGFGDIAARPDEVKVFSGDPASLQALTGWRAVVDPPDGVMRCLDLGNPTQSGSNSCDYNPAR